MSLLTYSRDQTSVRSISWFKYFAFLCTICVIPPKLENRVLGLLLSNVMFTQNSIFYLFKHKVLICLPSRTQFLTYLPDRNSLLSPPLPPCSYPPPLSLPTTGPEIEMGGMLNRSMMYSQVSNYFGILLWSIPNNEVCKEAKFTYKILYMMV